MGVMVLKGGIVVKHPWLRFEKNTTYLMFEGDVCEIQNCKTFSFVTVSYTHLTLPTKA